MKKKILIGATLVAVGFIIYPIILQQRANYKWERKAAEFFESPLISEYESEEEYVCKWLRMEYDDVDKLILKYEDSEGTRFTGAEVRREKRRLNRNKKAISNAQAKYCNY